MPDQLEDAISYIGSMKSLPTWNYDVWRDKFSFERLMIPSHLRVNEGQIRLFRAVLDQALWDMVVPTRDIWEREKERRKCIKFFKGRRSWEEEHQDLEPGLYFVCDLAYLNPIMVAKVAQEIAKRKGVEW